MRPRELVAQLRGVGCVYAEDEAALILQGLDEEDAIAQVVQGRRQGVPLEHLLGWAEFGGLRLKVAPGVFVPRRRSLLLAELAVAALPPGGCGVLDLCCGVGALAAFVVAHRPDVSITAVDIAPAAIACALVNLPKAEVLEGDLFAPLPAERKFDVIIASAPYVPTGAIRLLPVEARQYEERVALDGGPTGLTVARRIVDQVATHLAPTGTLLIETAASGAQQLVKAMERAGLTGRSDHDEELEATVVTGRFHSAISHVRG